MTVSQLSIDLESIHGGVLTVCLFSIVLENIHGGVMVCEEMSADRPDRDGS